MKHIELNKVPSWCPYTPQHIQRNFEFDLNSTKGNVIYYCVHCKKPKHENINSIRMRIRRGLFTSLCCKCAGEIERTKKETFAIKTVPLWMNDWLNSNKLSTIALENNLNYGKIIDVYQGKSLNRGIEFECIKCHVNIKASISRIKTNIKLKKHTGLCNKCLSGVKNNNPPNTKVAITEPINLFVKLIF